MDFAHRHDFEQRGLSPCVAKVDVHFAGLRSRQRHLLVLKKMIERDEAWREFFFTPPLNEYWAIFRVLCVWNVLAFALVYAVCGAVAGCVLGAKTRRRALAIVAVPSLTTVFGALIGLFAGGVLAFIVAALYTSSGFSMSWWSGIVWCLALPVSYTAHSLSKFVFN